MRNNNDTYSILGIKKISFDEKLNLLNVIDDAGFVTKFTIEPFLKHVINSRFGGNSPRYSAAIYAKPLSVDKTDESLTEIEFLNREKGRVIPPDFNYEGMTVGFVYSDDSNHENHKWMLEFRRGEGMEVFYNLFFGGVVFEGVNVATVSWKDEVWHGRFMIEKDDISNIVTNSDGLVTCLIGSNNNYSKLTDLSLVEKDSVELIIGYSTKNNYWYLKQVNSKGDTVGKVLTTKKILMSNLFGVGNIDWNRAKPLVEFIIETSNITVLKKIGNTILIECKNPTDLDISKDKI